MKKTPLIVLLVLLAAAILSGIVLFQAYRKGKNALSACETQISSMEEKIVHLNRESAALKEEIQDHRRQIEALKQGQGRIAELEQEIQTKEQGLLDREKQIHSMEERIAGLNREKALLEEEVQRRGRLLETMKSSQRRISELEQEIQTKEQGLLDREKQIHSMEERIAGLNREKALLEEEVQRRGRLLETMKSSQRRISELEEEIQTKERSILDLEREHAQLKEALVRERRALEELREAVKSRDGQITRLKAESEENRAEVLRLTEEVAKGEQERERLRSRLMDLQGQRNRLHDTITQLKSAHAAMISQLRSQIENKEVTISELEERLSITFVDHVLFESGSARITPQGKAILKKVGAALKSVTDRQIRVVGHTDNKPILYAFRDKFPSNWELSAARAGAVVRYFQEEIGLDPTSMEAVGRSFYDPVASNETEAGRAQNRRVNIIIAPKLGSISK